MDFFSFEAALLRLKKALGIQTDKEAAAALGMNVSAFNKRKLRGSFPEAELHALAQRCPDLGIDVTYVLTGVSLKEEAASRAVKVPAALKRLRGRRATATVAEAAGVTVDEWADFEGGRKPVPADFLKRLIKAFPNADPVELLGGPRREVKTATALEAVLLENYRSCSPADQEAIRHQAAFLANRKRR